jgi:hypothetical protein
MGIGAVVTLPLLTGRGTRVTRRLVVAWAMAAYGAAMLVFGASGSYAVGLVALLVAGGAYLGLASALNTTIQLQVDEGMRGKVLAVYVMLLTASLPAGLLLQAAVVGLAGPQLTVVAFGVAFVAVLAWLVLRASYLAHLDDDVQAEPQPYPEANGRPPTGEAHADHGDSSAQTSEAPAASGQPSRRGHHRQAGPARRTGG